MKIKPALYESLTPHQRIIATLEAMARDDDDERLRLVKTCPKKTYTQTDAAYADQMQVLITLAVTVECDLRGQALNFYIGEFIRDKSDEKMRHDPLAPLQVMSNYRAAWHNVLRTHGIDPALMEAFQEEVRHFGVSFLESLLPEPEENGVCLIEEGLKKIFKKFDGV